MKHSLFTTLLLSALILTPVCCRGQAARPWPSKIPKRGVPCPYPQSKDITGVVFTGRYAAYTHADTWFPSWATDGNMYSPFTDGSVEGVSSWSNKEAKATTGHAMIVGDDPLRLKVIPIGVHMASALPYGGRYPSATLVHNGVWYYGTYCLAEKDPHLNWDILGPFVGFRVSKDFGKTWTDTRHTPARPIFNESALDGKRVRMSAPHFVDFGRNMEHAPGGKAYLVGHGATRPDSPSTWISGDQVYMARVKPTPADIDDPSKYEFFAGRDHSGQALWTGRLQTAKPVAEWQDRTGVVTMTYNAPLRKYLMWITDGFPTISTMNTYLLESSSITGPWSIVTFMDKFGEQGYFVNLPSKFLSADGKTAWLSYSANFTQDRKINPPGGGYAMVLQEIRFETSSAR
jgi:hypothetical protein